MYIVFDTETTSLDPNQGELLTSYFAICDSKFKIMDEFGFETKPDSGIYSVDPNALAVNKIDLVEFNKRDPWTYSRVSDTLFRRIGNYLPPGKNGMPGKLIPVGHNFSFDVSFIKKLDKESDWKRYVAHKGIDTAYIGEFLKLIGFIAKDQSTSLSDIIKHFNLKSPGDYHQAKNDVYATIEVAKFYSSLKIMQPK